MNDPSSTNTAADTSSTTEARFCQSIDWYAEGESRTIEVNGVQATVRFVGRRGRRARIAITGPAGAVFRSLIWPRILGRHIVPLNGELCHGRMSLPKSPTCSVTYSKSSSIMRFISKLEDTEVGSSILRAASTPDTGRWAGSSNPSCTKAAAWSQ
jgi:hypothetical protein